MTFATMYPELIEKLIIVDVAPVHYGSNHYKYHLGLIESLQQLDLGTLKSRKQADLEVSKSIPVCSFYSSTLFFSPTHTLNNILLTVISGSIN